MGQEQIRLHLQPGETTVGQVLDRIRRESRDEHEKGRWFEELVARVLRENPEYEVAQVHRWRDWPERFDLTGMDARDLGIDLVAQHVDGAWTAIQCMTRVMGTSFAINGIVEDRRSTSPGPCSGRSLSRTRDGARSSSLRL